MEGPTTPSRWLSRTWRYFFSFLLFQGRISLVAMIVLKLTRLALNSQRYLPKAGVKGLHSYSRLGVFLNLLLSRQALPSLYGMPWRQAQPKCSGSDLEPSPTRP